MGLPRSHYVNEEQEGVYHCFNRCVRRAFLCGSDSVTGRDFSHRKTWIVDRLRFLSAIFAIEVCAYAVMENHYHTILRTRPDIVALWSDREVATRWLTLFPRHRDKSGTPAPPSEIDICALADSPDRIAQLRRRMSSLSWFNGRLNEFIARAANKEDKVKGRFWESRFKCQALLDDPAIAAGMVYVDLNLVRSGLAATPEESDFTSIQERIRAWQQERMSTPAVSGDPVPVSAVTPLPGITPESFGTLSHDCWLCPIQSDSRRRGILGMTATEYINLVDLSGRLTRALKPGTIDADLAPILLRIGANPDAWLDTVSRFGSRFHLAAGLLSHLRLFADQLGRRWLKGVASARAAFASSPPQPA
jgi:hypothetical protein